MPVRKNWESVPAKSAPAGRRGLKKGGLGTSGKSFAAVYGSVVFFGRYFSINVIASLTRDSIEASGFGL